ncbi:MAG: hypothetical protein HOI23_22525 [Deltaproteobacteria bacterium]|nr:hypothetical protein [Deltaproteobacteria bacterium]MBT6434794.1 hypothetical protein [Deltaproteobacteria bacterium]MBT6490588.1 hypothetical protein [Deltaproteobacteria bacterium]
MTATQLNPNQSFTPELLRTLDALDGDQNGVLDLTRTDVREALNAAGITDIDALDKWDGVRQSGQLNLMRVKNSGQARDGFSSRNTYFQNRTDASSRTRIFSAVVGARSEAAEQALVEKLADAGNWRDLTRTQYNTFFNNQGYDRGENHLTHQISALQELRTEARDPQLIKTVDAYVVFLEHINNSISANPEMRQAQSAQGLELLATARIEASTLSGDFSTLRSTLLDGAQDFEMMLSGFAAIATLAESRSGQVVNSADNQLAPFLVKTAFRNARDADQGGAIEGALNSYQHDINVMRVWTGRMAQVQNNISNYPSLTHYQDAMEQAVRGASPGMRQAARTTAEAQWRTANAQTHLSEADSAIQHGLQNVDEANTSLDSTSESLRSAENHAWQANRALAQGDTGSARQRAESIRTNLSGVDSEIAFARENLAAAMQLSGEADTHLTSATSELGRADEARLSVASGTYGRRFQGSLAKLQADILRLESHKDQLQEQLGLLDGYIEAASNRRGALTTGVREIRTAAGDVLTEAQTIETRQAEEAYAGALEEMIRNDVLVLNESGLAALIHAAADENGESSRVDFRVGGGVAVQGTIGVVGGRAWLQGMISSGVSVKRPDNDSVEVAIDLKAMVNAGVEAEFLFGLVGVGTEVTVQGGGKIALRFANEEDAARYLMQRIYAPIINEARNQVPADARDNFDDLVRVGPFSQEPPRHSVLRINSTDISVDGAVRARLGVPGVVTAHAKGGLKTQAVQQSMYDALTGEHRGESTTHTTTAYGEFGASIKDVGSVNVRAEVQWREVERDANQLNTTQTRNFNFQVKMGGNVARSIHQSGAPAILELAGEMLGVQGAPPFSDQELSAAGVSRELLEGVQTGITSQLHNIPGAQSSITLRVNVSQQDVSAPGATEPDYETQYTRASVKYSTFAGTGKGSLKNGGGALGTHFTAGVGYERSEVIGEVINENQAGENYVLRNAASYEDHPRFSAWAGGHRNAVADIFRSGNYNNNIPEDASIEIDGTIWNADQIQSFRASLGDSNGITMSRARFSKITQVMWQLERNAHRVSQASQH